MRNIGSMAGALMAGALMAAPMTADREYTDEPQPEPKPKYKEPPRNDAYHIQAATDKRARRAAKRREVQQRTA